MNIQQHASGRLRRTAAFILSLFGVAICFLGVSTFAMMFCELTASNPRLYDWMMAIISFFALSMCLIAPGLALFLISERLNPGAQPRLLQSIKPEARDQMWGYLVAIVVLYLVAGSVMIGFINALRDDFFPSPIFSSTVLTQVITSVGGTVGAAPIVWLLHQTARRLWRRVCDLYEQDPLEIPY